MHHHTSQPMNSSSPVSVKQGREGLAALHQMIIHEVELLLGCPPNPLTVSLNLLDPVAGVLNALPSGQQLPLQRGINGYAATHGKMLVVNDVAADRRYFPGEGPPNGAMIVAPLLDQQSLLGTLCVTAPSPRFLDARAQQIMTIAARYAVQTLIQASVHDSQTISRRQLALMLTAAQAMTSLSGPQELFGNITEGIQHLVPYEHALIFAYLPASDELRVVTGKSTKGRPLTRTTVSMKEEHSLSVRAARSRRARTYTPRVGHQGGLITESFLDGQDLALLCVPLISRGALRGIVTLARGDDFGSEDLRIIVEISPLMATALENIELYHDLRATHEHLTAIFAATTDGICVVDQDGKITRANEAMGELLGRPADHLVGMSCAGLIVNQNVQRAIGAAIQQGKAEGMIEHVLPERPGCAARQVTISVSPLPNGPIHHVVIMVHDITRLKIIDLMKQHLLKEVSHEIASPLHALNLHLDLALSPQYGGELPPGKQEYIRRARASSRRLNARMKDLLLLTEAKLNIYAPRLEPTDIGQVLAEVLDETVLPAEERGITLHKVDWPRQVIIDGDRERLEQVARNLLHNALKFTPQGGHVQIGMKASDQLCEFWIADTGCGIAETDLPHIFERFYQVPTDQRKQGQGLGLAIVKTIVDQHGGVIRVSSSPGKGSTFTVQFPMHAAPRSAP